MGMMINSDGDEDDVIAAINTTPLVDIMLVLLIIFLITVPVAIHTVPVKLPEEKNTGTCEKRNPLCSCLITSGKRSVSCHGGTWNKSTGDFLQRCTCT